MMAGVGVPSQERHPIVFTTNLEMIMSEIEVKSVINLRKAAFIVKES
jgi:hypothetical protein